MKNLPEDLQISAALLSLGLTYVNPSLVEDEEKINQQVNAPNILLEESTEEDSIGFTENRELSNEENDFDGNIQKSDIKTKVRFGIEKLNNNEKSKEENLKTMRKKLNEISGKSSNKYVRMFRENYKMENEVTSKLYKNSLPKYDGDFQKEIINEVRQKVNQKIKSYKNKNVGGIENEEEKSQKLGNYARELIFKLKSKESYDTDLSRNSFTNVFKFNGDNEDINQELNEEIKLKSKEKVPKILTTEKLQKPEGETVMQMEVDSEFQNKIYSGVENKLIEEKQLIPEALEMKYENENKPGELEGNQKLPEENNEEDDIVQLKMEIDPKLYQQLGDIKLQLFIKLEDCSEAQIDIDDNFEEELREKQSTSGIEIKLKNDVQADSELQQEFHENIQKELNREELNSVRDEFVEKSQQKFNEEKEIHDEPNNKTMLSNESVNSHKKKQKESVEKQQPIDKIKKDHSKTEPKLLGKFNIDILRKIFENKQLKINLDEHTTADELQNEIDKVKRKVGYLEQEIDVETEKKIIEDINKLSSPEERLKYFLHLDQKFTLIEERVKQICKDYFPPECVLVERDDLKKQTKELLQHLQKTIVRKDNEVLTESKIKVPTDLDIDCENKRQEELGDNVEEESREEFEEKLEEKKVENSDVSCKEEIHEEFDNARRVKLNNEMQEYCGIAFDETLKDEQENSDIDVEGSTQESYEEEMDLHEDSNITCEIQEGLEDKFHEVQEEYIRESDEEDSYVDIEGFDEEVIQHEFDIQPVPEFVGESFQESEEDSEEENVEGLGECVDINIVTEVVEDYVVEKCVLDGTTVEKLIPTEVFCKSDKFSSTAKELNSSTEDLNTIERKKSNFFMEEQVTFNDNILELKKGSQGYNFVEKQQEFKHFLENMQDLDVIPQELMIEQEQIDFKFQQRFREFQEDFYKIFKQEYDKGKKMFKSDLSTFNAQQQTFYELKDEFDKIKEDYKSFVLQKFFEDLQQKIDENSFLSIEELPKELNDNLLPQIDEHIEKEFAEMELDCHGLEPEFKYNVPLKIELDNSKKCNKKELKKKPFDLMKKLHSIHQKKLCEFAKSTTWPESCLYPSSLLDKLFEDPSEDKPNVIVFTLYPIDRGYSLKISMNVNEPPLEIFYDYAKDTVLDYVEKGKLPPDLLDLFDRAEPRIFYSGCVIAEIHDLIEFTNYLVSRILLRPSNESILRDLNLIIANNSSIDWTYEKKLLLESELLKRNYPVMCSEVLPIVGSTVNRQHQLISGRSVCLNPLKHLSETDDLNDGMYSSKFPYESFSEMMDSVGENIHNILWKFDFRVESTKVMKLYILCSTETQDFSLLLCSNLELESNVNIRVKINLETNQLKLYISMILEILKQRIYPAISVFRRYKSDDKLAPRYLSCVTALFNNKIYEPSYSDISEMIDIFLEMKSKNQVDENQSPTIPIQSDDNKTDKTKKNPSKNEKVNHNVQNKHFSMTNFLSDKEDVEMLNMNLREQIDLNSTMEILPTPATEIPSSMSKKIEIQPILSAPLLLTSVSGSTALTPSALSSTSSTPLISNSVTGLSLLPSLITVISSVPSHVTIVSSTTSKVSSSETSSIDSIPASEDHNVNIDTELKPITQSNTDLIENMNKNDDNALNLFENMEFKPPITYDIPKTASETNVTQSLSSQRVKKTKLIKHVHENGICLRRVFPNHTVNMKAVPQKSILFQKNIPVEQTATNFQLDNSTNLPKLTNPENSANPEKNLNGNDS